MNALYSILTGLIGLIIGYFLTLRRERWNLRRDLYARLLENLGEVQHALEELRELEIKYRHTEHSPPMEWLEDLRGRESKAADEIRRTKWVAKIMLRGETIQALQALEAEWEKARRADKYFDYLDQRLGAAHRAYELLVKAAKKDLRI